MGGMTINGTTQAVSKNSESDQVKNISAGAKFGAVAAGFGVYTATKIPVMAFSSAVMPNIKKLNESLTADEFQKVKTEFSNMIKSKGLDKKGVTILNASSKGEKAVFDSITQQFKKGIAKFFPKSYKDLKTAESTAQVMNGSNAFYNTATKEIIMSDKMALSGFHEAGHAINANLSKVGKALQKVRGATILALPIILISLCKNKKQEGEKPKNLLDKATDFVKKNAGKLTFATFVPMLAEEGLATLRGNKFAKQALNPKLAKKVSGNNALGFVTYLGMALATSIGAALAVKVRDKIVANKENNK